MVQLKDLTNSVYTTDDVINEIKDAATKASLQVLPYDLKFKNPSTDAIKFST
jgi:RNA-binding protein NOB1